MVVRRSCKTHLNQTSYHVIKNLNYTRDKYSNIYYCNKKMRYIRTSGNENRSRFSV